jgi:hypothetical protein
MSNPLLELPKLGQSVWYDNIIESSSKACATSGRRS